MAGDTSRLVRFANFARMAGSLRSPRGGWVASFLTPHFAECWGCLISHASLRGVLGLPHFSHLTSRKGTARRATTAFKDSGSIQTSSFRAQSRNPCFPALQHRCCDYAQHDGVCRAPLPPSPTPFPVFPHSYDLTPSLLRPHPLTPTTSPPHSYDLTPSPLTPHPLTPHPSPLTPHSSLLTPHSSLLTPHSSLLTPHSSLLTPHSSLLTPQTSPS